MVLKISDIMWQLEGDRCFRNTTIRQTLRVTSTSGQIRVRISNAYGLTPLPITSVTVAVPLPDPRSHLIAGSCSIQTATLKTVKFNDLDTVVIPNGAQAVSDPIEMSIEAGQVLSVSIHMLHGQAGIHVTSHPGSRTDSWLARGERTRTPSLSASGIDGVPVTHWYFLSAIEAWQNSNHGVLALLGDSITDGRNSTDNGNNRWPDLLFDRLSGNPKLSGRFSVANLSLGGNRVMTDGNGANAWTRLERDVISLRNLKCVIICEGVNDIGTADPEEADEVGMRLIQSYQQMITCLHTYDILAIGATLPPFDAEDPTEQVYAQPARVTAARKVNEWIRNSNSFDAIFDVASVLSEPTHSDRIRSEFDCGDHLHPNQRGFQALADFFPIEVLYKCA